MKEVLKNPYFKLSAQLVKRKQNTVLASMNYAFKRITYVFILSKLNGN